MKFSEAHEFLFLGSSVSEIAVLDLKGPFSTSIHNKPRYILNNHLEQVTCFELAQDKYLFSGEKRGLLCMFEISAESVTHLVTKNHHRSPVWALKAGACGQRVYSGDGTDTVLVWRIEPFDIELEKKIERTGVGVNSFCLSRDKDFMVLSLASRDVEVWDLETESVMRKVRGSGKQAFSVDIVCEDSLFVAYNADDTMSWFDFEKIRDHVWEMKGFPVESKVVGEGKENPKEPVVANADDPKLAEEARNPDANPKQQFEQKQGQSNPAWLIEEIVIESSNENIRQKQTKQQEKKLNPGAKKQSAKEEKNKFLVRDDWLVYKLMRQEAKYFSDVHLQKYYSHCKERKDNDLAIEENSPQSDEAKEVSIFRSAPVEKGPVDRPKSPKNPRSSSKKLLEKRSKNLNRRNERAGADLFERILASLSEKGLRGDPIELELAQLMREMDAVALSNKKLMSRVKQMENELKQKNYSNSLLRQKNRTLKSSNNQIKQRFWDYTMDTRGQGARAHFKGTRGDWRRGPGEGPNPGEMLPRVQRADNRFYMHSRNKGGQEPPAPKPRNPEMDQIRALEAQVRELQRQKDNAEKREDKMERIGKATVEILGKLGEMAAEKGQLRGQLERIQKKQSERDSSVMGRQRAVESSLKESMGLLTEIRKENTLLKKRCDEVFQQAGSAESSQDKLVRSIRRMLEKSVFRMRATQKKREDKEQDKAAESKRLKRGRRGGDKKRASEESERKRSRERKREKPGRRPRAGQSFENMIVKDIVKSKKSKSSKKEDTSRRKDRDRQEKHRESGSKAEETRRAAKRPERDTSKRATRKRPEEDPKRADSALQMRNEFFESIYQQNREEKRRRLDDLAERYNAMCRRDSARSSPEEPNDADLELLESVVGRMRKQRRRRTYARRTMVHLGGNQQRKQSRLLDDLQDQYRQFLIQKRQRHAMSRDARQSRSIRQSGNMYRAQRLPGTEYLSEIANRGVESQTRFNKKRGGYYGNQPDICGRQAIQNGRHERPRGGGSTGYERKSAKFQKNGKFCKMLKLIKKIRPMDGTSKGAKSNSQNRTFNDSRVQKNASKLGRASRASESTFLRAKTRQLTSKSPFWKKKVCRHRASHNRSKTSRATLSNLPKRSEAATRRRRDSRGRSAQTRTSEQRRTNSAARNRPVSPSPPDFPSSWNSGKMRDIRPSQKTACPSVP